MTDQERAKEEVEAFKWMTSKGYDRKASKDIAQILVKYKEEQLTIHSVVVNEAVLRYETCQRGKLTMCKCKNDQDCKEQSEVAYYCKCDVPLVRTDVSGTEYCEICEWDLEQ